MEFVLMQIMFAIAMFIAFVMLIYSLLKISYFNGKIARLEEERKEREDILEMLKKMEKN